MRFVAGILCAATLLVVSSSPAWAWGGKGHQSINAAATGLMASPGADFFRANKQALKAMATVPDYQWKSHGNKDNEGPLHFFQWDLYSSRSGAQDSSQYGGLGEMIGRLGGDFVRKNGMSIWRVEQLYNRLVKALKTKSWTEAVQMAGVLGHYVGDLSQPMHATSDYDGQSIGRRGIHRYFETELVDPIDDNVLVERALAAGGPLRQSADTPATTDGGSLVRVWARDEGVHAHARIQSVLELFQANGGQDDDGLREMFAPTMGAGAANLARIWDEAVVQAGANDFPADAVVVPNPDWIPLDGAPAAAN